MKSLYIYQMRKISSEYEYVIQQYINVGSNPNEARTKIQKCQLKQCGFESQ